jgi:hypothetical protein
MVRRDALTEMPRAGIRAILMPSICSKKSKLPSMALCRQSIANSPLFRKHADIGSVATIL